MLLLTKKHGILDSANIYEILFGLIRDLNWLKHWNNEKNTEES